MKVCITVDVEQDAAPFMSSYRGVGEGLHGLLALLSAEAVPATFFATGDVARRFPEAVKKIIAGGHELGCHGDTHARFDKMTTACAERELETATGTLKQFYDVVSFRAPNLRFPKRYLPLLRKLGYKIDSSEARHKDPFARKRMEAGIMRIPASVTSLELRLPAPVRNFILGRLGDTSLLLVHTWEFVDMRRGKLRIDCRWKTGSEMEKILAEAINFYKRRGASFCRISDCLDWQEKFC